MRRYSSASGEWPTQLRFQYSGWCRSAKPPSISARTKFIVIAERACALIMRRGSGRRACSVNAGAIDHVAAVARQRDIADRLGIGGARLRVLAGKAPDPHHRLAHAMHQHQAHLQQHLEPVRDHLRRALAEALGAIAALQQEALALLRFGQLLLERKDFPRGHQRRQAAQFLQRRRQLFLVRVLRQLQRRALAPGLRAPVGGSTSRRGDHVAGRMAISGAIKRGGRQRTQPTPPTRQSRPRSMQASTGRGNSSPRSRIRRNRSAPCGSRPRSASRRACSPGPGPHAGTWSGGRFCNQTWRPAMAAPVPAASKASTP